MAQVSSNSVTTSTKSRVKVVKKMGSGDGRKDNGQTTYKKKTTVSANNEKSNTNHLSDKEETSVGWEEAL